jgi:hypothetical protein
VYSWNAAIFLTGGRVTTIPIGNRIPRKFKTARDVKRQARGATRRKLLASLPHKRVVFLRRHRAFPAVPSSTPRRQDHS